MRIVPEEDDSVFGNAQINLNGICATFVKGRSDLKKRKRNTVIPITF
jgi:hypothetical protein